MPRREMLMVFCYDIALARVRRRVSAILEDQMVRVQRSVFEARMSQARAESLATQAAAELLPGDSLRIYAVGADGLARSRSYGPLPLTPDEDYWLL